jgi:uncharacterized membrane protein YozB (DUF420 family)
VRQGFLGTAAPLRADLILLLEVAMGVALFIGALLARARRYRWHGWCQSVVVLLNLAVVLLGMTPSFIEQVAPKIPAKLNRTFYALATAHAVLGSIAEIGGLYLVLAAGTKVLPHRFRLAEYKRWMRGVLALWWLVLLLGLATYIRWYAG